MLVIVLRATLSGRPWCRVGLNLGDCSMGSWVMSPSDRKDYSPEYGQCTQRDTNTNTSDCTRSQSSRAIIGIFRSVGPSWRYRQRRRWDSSLYLQGWAGTSTWNDNTFIIEKCLIIKYVRTSGGNIDTVGNVSVVVKLVIKSLCWNLTCMLWALMAPLLRDVSKYPDVVP